MPKLISKSNQNNQVFCYKKCILTVNLSIDNLKRKIIYANLPMLKPVKLLSSKVNRLLSKCIISIK